MDADEWNERYSGQELVWTAEPNRFVVAEVADLGPGTALDVACGEGRNAVWLARRGWSVRAVDFAEAAVAKGRQLAAAAGVEVNWVVADVTRYRLRSTFDLVLIAYLHLPPVALSTVIGRAVGALAAKGTLLVVGHHVDNLEGGYGGPREPDVLHDHTVIAAMACAAGEAAGDGMEIEVVKAERVERPVATDEGERIALDSLVRVQRT